MIKISICGHNSHHLKPCSFEYKNGLPVFLLLIVKTEAWFLLEGEVVRTQPNMVILFDRNTYICYGYEAANYNDDWIHFNIDEPEHDLLFTSLKIPFNKPLYPTQFQGLSHYVHLLANVFHSDSPHANQIQDALMHALLYTLDEELAKASNPQCYNKHYAAFTRLRAQIYSNPSNLWSVTSIAKTLCLSVSYFQHLYKLFFACSCQQDIIHSRLEQAKFYLTTSNMGIKNLSEFCGYENDLHFMRQFKKFEKMTPSEYRKIYSRFFGN